jgi:ribosome-associated protein
MSMNELKSKSQKKRDANALQDLGVKLVALNLEKLEQLPLSAQLKGAILDARALKSFGAIRRQAMWIGKLIRAEGGDTIVEAYAGLQLEDSAQTAGFHEVEHWRTRLIHEGKDALTLFVETYPSVNVQQLRQLIKKAVDDLQHEKNTGASRALFRYIRSFIQ